jgi:hypothetical protein
MKLYDLVPDAEALLALEPEEFAGILLEYLNALPPPERENLNRGGYGHSHYVQEYPPPKQDALRRAMMEAWVWLEREGLIVPKPGSDGWSVLSRRAQRLRTRLDPVAGTKGALRPRGCHDLDRIRRYGASDSGFFGTVTSRGGLSGPLRSTHQTSPQ